MSELMEEEFMRWTARRKAALVTEILQRKKTVSVAALAQELAPSELEGNASIDPASNPSSMPIA